MTAPDSISFLCHFPRYSVSPNVSQSLSPGIPGLTDSGLVLKNTKESPERTKLFDLHFLPLCVVFSALVGSVASLSFTLLSGLLFSHLERAVT